MKNYQYLILFLLLIFNLSCSNDDSLNIESIWVDSERVSCTGAFEQMCYKIQENEIINESAWELFYDNIEGFDNLYEEGYIYKISITKINIDNPPADSSSIKYLLKKILSKKLEE